MQIFVNFCDFSAIQLNFAIFLQVAQKFWDEMGMGWRVFRKSHVSQKNFASPYRGVSSFDSSNFSEKKFFFALNLDFLGFQRQMEDGRTVADYDIKPGYIVHMVRRLRGGGPGFTHYCVAPQFFDPQWNFDFRNIKVRKAEKYNFLIFYNMIFRILHFFLGGLTSISS